MQAKAAHRPSIKTARYRVGLRNKRDQLISAFKLVDLGGAKSDMDLPCDNHEKKDHPSRTRWVIIRIIIHLVARSITHPTSCKLQIMLLAA